MTEPQEGGQAGPPEDPPPSGSDTESEPEMEMEPEPGMEMEPEPEMEMEPEPQTEDAPPVAAAAGTAGPSQPKRNRGRPKKVEPAVPPPPPKRPDTPPPSVDKQRKKDFRERCKGRTQEIKNLPSLKKGTESTVYFAY